MQEIIGWKRNKLKYVHNVTGKCSFPNSLSIISVLLTGGQGTENALLVAMDFFPYPGEQQFLGFIRANYLSLFPKLLVQSQFNRRARRWEGMLEELRRFWVVELGAMKVY
jgi:hypothetical protein